jgi:DNA-binding response OmpR family regulator
MSESDSPAMRLLLIEDHRDIAANIAEFFEARGEEVQHALDGENGLQMALADSYDAIVLDLMLPGLDGLSLCRQLRQAGHTRVPVLMLTAKDLLADKIEGFEAGADDYLVKPFSLAELDARLKALVRRASVPETPRVLSVGDLRFDLDTLEAERSGERLKLNPTTRRLLIVLLQNSHRVVTRAELERELWGDQPPQGDFLRAHMHALRTAIDKNFPIKLLHTIHGTGYRLSAEPVRS